MKTVSDEEIDTVDAVANRQIDTYLAKSVQDVKSSFQTNPWNFEVVQGYNDSEFPE